MQKHLKYDIAKIYNKLGFDEKTDYLYLTLYPGLKTVKGDLNNPVGEQIYHEGDLVKSDEDWGIIYPSPYWIPAPYIFDIVIWLKNLFNLIIITKFNDEVSEYSYDLIWSDDFKQLKLDEEFNNRNKTFLDFSSVYNNAEINEKTFISLEKCYEDAINNIALVADKNNWFDKLYKYI